MCFETPGLREFFKNLGECPHLILGFRASTSQLCTLFSIQLYLYSYFVLGCSLIFVCGRVPKTVHVYACDECLY